ncbi:MAG TPA: PQQ-binding-like beta-propeller repeat protein, partial [Capsulimonadaceae bacterium]|nr:PQQ-binding-like beta-propeller repeat protein [Capsulimonadaceae bacterium]
MNRMNTTKILKCAGLAALAGLALAIPSLSRAQSVATTYQIDPAHTGASDAPNIVYPLVQKWAVSLPGNISYPIIARGKIFVTVADPTVGEVKLYALNEATGAIVWGPLAIGSQWNDVNATYDNDTVFVNDTGTFQAFNADTGAIKWTAPLPLQTSFVAPPTAANGTLYVVGAGDGGTLYSVRESDGHVNWSIPITSDSGVTVGSDGIYLSPSGKEALKVNTLTGATIWHAPPDEIGQGSIGALYQGDFFVREPFAFQTSNGAEYDAASGASVGSFNAIPAPAFDNGLAFFLSGNTLSGNTISTQSQAWSLTSASTDPFVTAPLAAGGAVIEGTSSGSLAAYNQSTGAVVWTANAGAKLSAPQEFSFAVPVTGLAAAGGLVVVPAAQSLVAYGSASADITASVHVLSSALTQ